MSVASQQPPSLNHSRDTSPAVTIRGAPELWYEYPGSKDVYSKDPGISPSMDIPPLGKRSSLRSERYYPAPAQPEEVKSSSLPDESKLAQINSFAHNSNPNLSQSTERINILKNEIASLKETLMKLVSQQSKGNPENPS